jgi:hypothetical protein
MFAGRTILGWRIKGLLTYLDQNALIKVGFKALGDPAFRAKLDAAIDSGRLTVVVSTWHLIETANTPNLANAVKLAEFMDSLKPAWLLEKYDITKLEVHEDFFRFARLPHDVQARVRTRSAAIAALNKEKYDPKFDIPSRAFVKQWIEHPEQLLVLRKSYERNTEALAGMRQARKDGKVTDALKKQTNQAFLREHMPKTTPEGLQVPREMTTEYIERADVASMPTIVIESAISDHEWNAEGGADRNTQIDKFHLISALPYVDEIVSDDAFFHKSYPVAEKTGYVRAKVISVDDFLKRF